MGKSAPGTTLDAQPTTAREAALADRPWSVERQGIEPVSDARRHGRATDLFWVWFAANLGILGIVYGALLVAAGLNLWQSLLVAVVGSAGSFALVGVLSVGGVRSGAPALTLSRAAFGVRGNLGPTALSWLSLVGWETISVITAAYALLGLLKLAGVPEGVPATLVSLVAVAALVVVFGLLGHATLVWVQRAATWIFGALTLVIVVLLLRETDWRAILSAPPGPWDAGVLAMVSVVAAGTGIGWANAGADYARYLPRAIRGRSVALWTTAGASLPLVVLIVVGAVLAGRAPTLATAENPVAAIGALLPGWMAVPYLLTAIGGLVAAADLSIYSSGLNLLALGVPLRRTRSVLVDGALMVAGSAYVLLVAQDFVGPFVSFLQLLADGIAAWAAVALVDLLLRRRIDPAALEGPGERPYYRAGMNPAALLAWGAGILVGLAFTASPLFTGPFARGVFGQSSLGYFLGFGVAAVIYAALYRWGASFVAAPQTPDVPVGAVR